MKKIKYLLFLMFLCTGCSAEFEVNVDDNFISEELRITSSIEEQNKIDEYQKNTPLQLYFEDKNYNPYFSGRQDGVNYYDYDVQDKNGLKEVSYLGKFTIDESLESNIIKSSVDNYKVVVKKDELHIVTSPGINLRYDDLTELKIIVSSKYEVMYSNADQVIGDKLIWNVNRYNSANKSIVIDYSTNFVDTSTQDDANNDEDKNIITDDVSQDNSHNQLNIPTSVVVIGGLLSFFAILTILIVITKRKQ